jgi:NIMA (never in mitosis gene a)-related kinase
MATLNHAFDSDSLRGLVARILKGNYPPPPKVYSRDLSDLIGELLQKDPHKRPTTIKILEKPFLQVSNLFF